MPKIKGLLELQDACDDGSPFVGGIAIPASYKDFNRNRELLFLSHANTMFLRLLGMFEWKNLPKTLKAETLEKNLLRFGFAIVTDVPHEEAYKNGGIYCLPGNFTGPLDADLLPTQVTVTSTWLNYSKSGLEIGKDAVLIRNDTLFIGATDIVARYSSQQADLGLTFRLQAVAMRVNHVLQANDDTAMEDAKNFLKNLEEGELGVVGGDALPEMLSFDSKDYGQHSGTSIKDTLEAMQWLSAHEFIEFGLNDNYNMKREAINSTETDANADTLLTLAEEMLKWRKKGAEELNRVYGLSVSVDYSETWKRVKKELEMASEAKKAEVDALKNGDDPADAGDEKKDEVNENDEEK